MFNYSFTKASIILLILVLLSSCDMYNNPFQDQTGTDEEQTDTDPDPDVSADTTPPVPGNSGTITFSSYII